MNLLTIVSMVLVVPLLLLILYGYFGPGERRWEIIIYPPRYGQWMWPRKPKGAKYNAVTGWFGMVHWKLWRTSHSASTKAVRLAESGWWGDYRWLWWEKLVFALVPVVALIIEWVTR